MITSSIVGMQNSSKDAFFRILRQIAYDRLLQKYSSGPFLYNNILSEKLIFNEPCRIVSILKDYLLLYSKKELILRYYERSECKGRLNKILAFYELYSKVFPNYMILNENKYLFKNIRKKQKMIDAANELLEEEEKSKILVKENNDLFTKTIKEEINNYQKINDFDIYINQSYEKSISISICNKKKISQYLLRDNTPNEKKNTNFDSFVTS